MGFGDKLKQLLQQLQQAVSNHEDKIHSAVDTVGNVANKTTKGKFEDQIAKAGEKAHAGVGKVASNGQQRTGTEGTTGATAGSAEGGPGSPMGGSQAGTEASAADAMVGGEDVGESPMGAAGVGEPPIADTEGAADGHEDESSESSAATQEGAD